MLSYKCKKNFTFIWGYKMKKIRKMDEMELMIQLKTVRLCYLALIICIVGIDLYETWTKDPSEKSMYIIILGLINAITYLIATWIYAPKKAKKEKQKDGK